ncbi:adenosylcobinamide-phosphate synthase CbiB [Polaromonas naphthalenivorans]|uniref:Cobalamin biosynthesis protein CobD n=1 Tax=Polaromonas naphthalenivorans (strain CJ2) TaxID=365044 RepID=A1VP78_POLNA|nr:adenosylcobinamide-phosphate synthase CbiB [Polaromonas naphthalenivorans]ABM37456.1 adenosylcobinamide-phosphate synthase [Polaromonas naphthalenivorans CJ2]
MPLVLAFTMPVVLLLALWIDRRWGEPPVAFHPVVWIGHYLKACGRVTVRCPPAPAFVLGALAWMAGAAAAGALAWALQALSFWQLARFMARPGIENGLAATVLIALMAWLLKSMLSWRMLVDEVGAVEAALRQSLPAGRERLSWLVSRDTASLSESQVRESVIETLAENLNDSVVAPIFWFVLLGLPGAAVYRFANTADAMWGYRGTYRGQHWEWAGKWAARADDALSWLPARLTAWLLMGVTRQVQFGALRREAARTPSPNSGWPMAAMAMALGVTLSKPGVYTLNATGRAPRAGDVPLAQKNASKVVFALVPYAVIAIVSVAWMI